MCTPFVPASSPREKTRLSSASHARRRRCRSTETQGAGIDRSTASAGRRIRGRVCRRRSPAGDALPLWKRWGILRGISDGACRKRMRPQGEAQGNAGSRGYFVAVASLHRDPDDFAVEGGTREGERIPILAEAKNTNREPDEVSGAKNPNSWGPWVQRPRKGPALHSRHDRDVFGEPGRIGEYLPNGCRPESTSAKKSGTRRCCRQTVRKGG